MVPSHTVENYLKAIYQAQTTLAEADALVPMGQLASALGVVPGTATTMVKALAESGLVRYEPYAGVRLTKAGEKLAALVLRRHRLVELFLVKVMGMSWTEVHDEAELLEHAVSDRLIDRIDAMLGRPEVDPHGDPIPSAEGTVARPTYDTLLTCPLNQPMRVSRVSDQDREFLEFIERHDLKPGALVEVAERDAAADSVRVKGSREFTIGARAASKVLVRAAEPSFCCSCRSAVGGGATAATLSTGDGAVQDYRQLVPRRGGLQSGSGDLSEHLQRGTRRRTRGRRPSPRSGRSFTDPPVLLHPRLGSGEQAAVRRRAAQLPVSGDARRSRAAGVLSAAEPDPANRQRLDDGVDATGLQFNLPFSKQTRRCVLALERRHDLVAVGQRRRRAPQLRIPFLAGSAIVRLHPMFHAMLETVLQLHGAAVGIRRPGASDLFTLSPGVRGGWDIGDQQLILGRGRPDDLGGWPAARPPRFFYFVVQLPFKK